MTVTPTLTLIPTPKLPVGPGDNLPQPLLPITADNLASLSELARYGTANIYSTLFSPDRSVIFSLTGEGVKAYNPDSMQHLAWFMDVDPLRMNWGTPLWGVSSSRNGQRFSMLTSHNQAQVYDLEEGLVYSSSLPAFWMPWATISSDGQAIALPRLGDDEWSSFWELIDLDSGERIADGIGMNVRFSPAGTYLVGDANETLYIYRTSDYQEQTQIGLRAGGETALAWSFSPDDRYLAVVMPDSVTVWEVATRERVRQFIPITGAGAAISQAFFSENSGQMAVVEYIERVSSHMLIWDVTDGSLVSNQPLDEVGLYNYDQVLLTPDGLDEYTVPREDDGSDYQAPRWQDWQLAFDLNNSSLSLVDFIGWDGQTQQVIGKACSFAFVSGIDPFCQEVAGSLGILTDGMGSFYSLWQGEGNDISLYSGLEQSGTPLITFSSDGYLITPMGISPDQNLLVISLGAGMSTLQVLEIPTGRVLLMEDTSGRIADVRFSTDGTRLAASISSPELSYPQVLVYDAAQNAVLFRLPAREMMASHSAVLSPDGQFVAYRFERSDALRWRGIQVWDPLHQRQIAGWEGAQNVLGDPMAFSPDGRLLATSDDYGTVFLLDAESGVVLHQWPAHTDLVLSVAFSPDGTLLATSGVDGFLRVWGINP